MTSCRLVRVSYLEDTDVINLSGLVLSRVKLNDGSWELCLHISDIKNFRLLFQHMTEIVVDMEHNPLKVLPHDSNYFGSCRAQNMNRIWLQKRAVALGYPIA